MTTPSGFSSIPHAGDEVVQVGDLRQHVVADDEVCLRPSAASCSRQVDAKEIDPRRHAFLDGDLRDIRRRLDPEHRDAERQEVLQQIAVIAGEFDGKAVAARALAAAVIVSQ